MVLLALILTAAAYDLRFRRIPNWLTATGVALGFATNIFERGIWQGLQFSLLGFALALAIYLFLFAIRAMSGGDGKLMAAVGSLVGWKCWVSIFIVTTVVGAIAGVAVAIRQGRLKKTFWNVGFILSEMRHGRPAYLANEELDVRSGKALRMPHGAAIAVATLIYVGFTTLLQ